MHPAVFAEFDRVCAAHGAGGAVLEIGALPSDESLLCLAALAGASEKVGVDLVAAGRHRDFAIVRMNANTLEGFPDARFDTILCNAVLEHDPCFWRTLAAIRRVARPGALVAIGVPGFDRLAPAPWRTLLRRLRAAPLIGRRFAGPLDPLLAATPTLVPHEGPGDYYRFSPRAVREVFFAGMRDVEVRTLLSPPRVIGAGRMP